MTSKNLFFKLMREDLKRKVWAIGLSFLMFFFWMPVMAAMRVSDLLQQYERWITNGVTFGIEERFHTRLMSIVAGTVGLENGLAAFTIGTAAIVMALTGFMYLHSKKQMDFYHSIPVRREWIFAVKYLNGIFIVLSTYLLNLLFTFLVLGMNGVEVSVLLSTGIPTFLIHAAGYLMIYGLMTVAVMLTGNFFISILGGIVLFAYIPAAVSLVQGLMYLFFVTVNTRGIALEQLLCYGSPVSYYAMMIADGIEAGMDHYGAVAGAAGIAAVAGVVLAVIAVLLYKKRPSESAGKSMAFAVTKAPIKIMMVVPITIFTSLLFWTIYYSMTWAVFGFVLGLVVTHCIVEIIYHFEFRKLFANLPHMAVSAVLALAVIAVFRFDLFGYDTYLPKKAELTGASICANSLQDWIDYGLPKVEDTNHYSWNHIQENEFVVNNMKVTDQEVIFALAESGIANAKAEKERKYTNEEADYVYSGKWTSLEVGFQLANGKTVYRNYHVNISALRDVFDRMYANEEYKAGVSPVMSYTMDNIMGIYEYKQGEIQEVKADRSLQEAILNAYKEEYAALTLEERSNEAPVTSLRFLTKGEYEYLHCITLDRAPNYTGAFRLEDMNDVNFFPVYPSYKKTLALLAECGIDDFGPVHADEVQRIEVICNYELEPVQRSYEGDTIVYGERTVVERAVPEYADESARTITLENNGDPETMARMEEVLDCAVDQALAYKNGLQRLDGGIRIQVYMKDVNEGKSTIDQEYVSYLFPLNRIPEFVNEKFGLNQIVNRGIINEGIESVVQ